VTTQSQIKLINHHVTELTFRYKELHGLHTLLQATIYCRHNTKTDQSIHCKPNLPRKKRKKNGSATLENTGENLNQVFVKKITAALVSRSRQVRVLISALRATTLTSKLSSFSLVAPEHCFKLRHSYYFKLLDCFLPIFDNAYK